MTIAKTSVSDAVEMIIYEVDQRFPSALLPIDSKLEIESLIESLMDRCYDIGYDIEELFRTAEMRDDEEKLLAAICSLEETEATRGLDSAVMDLKSSLEPLYLAIGYAAGLRAAAIPTATVRVMMLGLLRNFNRADKAADDDLEGAIRLAVKEIIARTPPENHGELVTNFEKVVLETKANWKAEDSSPIYQNNRRAKIRAERAAKVRLAPRKGGRSAP